MVQLLRNALYYRIALTKKTCGWRAVNLAGIFKNALTIQQRAAKAARITGKVAQQAISRSTKLSFDAIKPAVPAHLKNLYKILLGQGETALRKAWYLWTKNMYQERALDWE